MRLKFIVVLFIGLAGCAMLQPENQAAATCDVQLGLGYLEAGEIELAHHKLQLAVKEAPHSAVSLSAMAYYYEQLGEDAQALAWYQRALQQAPTGQVYNNYGVFLCGCHQYQQAMQQFDNALTDTNYLAYKTYTNAGLCALANNDKPTAKPLLEKALSYQPNDVVLRQALLRTTPY